MKKLYKTSEETRKKARERMREKRRAAGIKERQSFFERFWGRVQPVTESGCWLWMGHVGHSGHGHIWKDGRLCKTHRISWEIKNGTVPKNKFILHKCDVPSCVNPDHLFVGTQQDNLEDMRRKGRAAVGEKQGHSKLTAEKVLAIRNDIRGPSAIAKDYGISAPTVCDIKSKRSWSHIP